MSTSTLYYPLNSQAKRVATRAIFFVAGFAMGLWASLVPYAQKRLNFDAGSLGMLLLCLGTGSLLAMLFSGKLIGRFGCKKIMLLGIALTCFFLPTLAFIDQFPLMALCLFFFGAGIGLVDVAVNVQGSMVEQSSDKPLMSGFHCLFSVGSIAGAGGGAILFTIGLMPLTVTFISIAVIVIITSVVLNDLIPFGDHKEPSETVTTKPRPNFRLYLMALMCMICFMAEGAVLDWGGVFLTNDRGLDVAHAGWGFAIFGGAMSVMRFTGDKVVSLLGRKHVLIISSIFAMVGYAIAVIFPDWRFTLLGFALVGVGAANIVPVLITLASQEKVMPVNMSVAMVATMGYFGVLGGPALIGFIAHLTDLYIAFSIVSLTFLIIAIGAFKLKYTHD
ncbi:MULTISPECIES: MFS transporter [Yersinia]|jgi:predicted MFS family arabinose efflux permease|uniref:MFS transporter n=1 Tax=Yersinia TaxID=629 RepID=UPI0005DC52EB|nr:MULTISPECIES: MFS transporter [Yersinia]HEC1652350.1 MFS transporter [Yersinia enterocolitica]ATM85582.1 MFS transporter [Yersinia frederiksenii]MCB5315971.1 MFS transporter [Yersinia massiliensis]CNL24438.1 putative inner membrane protein [Yersinia frederiksenii]HEI6966470.1 MFS transporter [Yersinia enterocolitica]